MPPSLMNVASENLIMRLSSKLSQSCALVPPEDAALKCKIICVTRGDEIHLISFFKDTAMPKRIWSLNQHISTRDAFTSHRPGSKLSSYLQSHLDFSVCLFQREWCPTSTVQPYQPCCCQVECTFSAPMPSAGQQIVLFICSGVFVQMRRFPLQIFEVSENNTNRHIPTGGCQTESDMQACLLYRVGLYLPCCNLTASSRRWVEVEAGLIPQNIYATEKQLIYLVGKKYARPLDRF